MTQKVNIHIIPASHLDYGWAASPGECFAYITEIIRMAVEDIAGDYPDYKFTIEYALFLKHFLEVYPEYLPVVKTLIQEGQLEVCPSMSGFIEQFLDGEMIIHQLVSGKRWIRETFGIDPVTAQHTDLPGHIFQIPQFLQGVGILNFAYSRYHPPVPLHMWKAPNGSVVVACCHHHAAMDTPCSWEGYGWGWVHFVANQDLESLAATLPKEIERNVCFLPSKDQPLLMGCESDLQPPEPGMLKLIWQWNEAYPDAMIQVSTISQYFKAVDREKLPVFLGEAPYAFFALPAIYIPCALEMRRAENALTAATKWSVFAQQAGMGKAQLHRIERAKDALALPHDHNTGGRRGEINDMERHKDALHARLEGESILQEASMSFTVNINYSHQPAETYPIVVFNSLSWNRTDVVETYVELPMAGVRSLILHDARGKQIPCQILKTEDSKKYNCSRIYLLFVAADVPAHGYDTFYLRPSKETDGTKSDLIATASRIKNNFFDLIIQDKKIKTLKWDSRDLVRSGDKTFNEIFMIEDKMDNTEAPPWAIADNYTGRAWQCQMKQVEVLETGPVRAVVRFYGKIQKSSFIQDVIVYQQLERIDFRHTLDYKSSMHTQTRVAYPLQVPEATVTYESPYSAVRLEKDEMPGTFRGHGERWVQKWIDLSNKNFGITLATRQISHAISPEGIEPILVRTSQCCGTIFYHFDQAHQYTFEYSLMAHAKDWRNANAHRHGWEFNSRLASTTMTTCFPIKPIRKSRQLPERDQFWWVNHNNVVITSISPSQANDAILIRLVEYFGKANTVMLKSKSIIDSVELVNFLEEHISDLTTDGKSIKLPVDKYGIYTLKVRLKK